MTGVSNLGVACGCETRLVAVGGGKGMGITAAASIDRRVTLRILRPSKVRSDFEVAYFFFSFLFLIQSSVLRLFSKTIFFL